MPRSSFTSRSRLVVAPAVAGALLAAGCYEAPDDLKDEQVLSVAIEAREEQPVANGLGRADIEVSLDSSTALSHEIEIEVSSGIIDFVQANADDAKTIKLKVPVDGHIKLPVQYGRDVGQLHVEARIGDFVSFDELDLGRSKAEDVRVDLDTLFVDADGRDEFTVSLVLFRNDDAEVSFGQRVQLLSCCTGEDDELENCEPRAPFRLPPLVSLAEGDRITVPVIAERLTAADAEEFSAFVLAALPNEDSAAITCATAGPSTPRAELTVRKVVVE